ncbi:MAG: hypothetical protein AAFN12_05070 [Cyanobacteria bacterium J06560_2]
MAITLKTDNQGLAIIDRARVHKNWTALAVAWCERANVSLSTLKRFREKKAIQKDAFIAICQAVDITDWQKVVASNRDSEVAVLMRRYRQSKRIIAEEVLSNLDSLDARLDFVAQAFSNDPKEAQRQLSHLKVVHHAENDSNVYPIQPPRSSHTADSHTTQHTTEQPVEQKRDLRQPDKQPVFSKYPIKIEANVSIIQILMEI